jgi:hypothetical protein
VAVDVTAFAQTNVTKTINRILAAFHVTAAQAGHEPGQGPRRLHGPDFGNRAERFAPKGKRPVGMNRLLAARGRIVRVPIIATGLRKVSAGASFLEMSGMRTRVERWAGSEQYECQSRDHCLHFSNSNV